jgi:hypothetical protein
MPVTIEDPEPVVRNTTFTRTITPDPGADTVTGIICTPVGNIDSGITISTTATTIVLSGSYEDAFSDEIKSIPEGESNLITTPTISTIFPDVPDNHIIFEANQDPARIVTRQYTAEVTIENVETQAISTETIIFNHIVNTDVVTFMNKLKEIYR